MLGKHYKVSLRLQAIIQSPPPKEQPPLQDKDKHVSRFSRPKQSKNDPELALPSIELQVPKNPSASSSTVPPALIRSNTTRGLSNDVNHYILADQMRNYHAIDVGQHCKALVKPQ